MADTGISTTGFLFDEIYLTGAGVSLVGSGTMDRKTERLKLTFLTGPLGKLPRIARADELLTSIVGEIVEFRVTGTLERPRMTPVALRSLDAIYRTLLNPSLQSD